MNPSIKLRPSLLVAVSLALGLSGCASEESSPPVLSQSMALHAEGDYCAVPEVHAELLVDRPSAGEDPVDDVNWFARPVPHAGEDRIVAFATHNQNHLYNLTRGTRVAIPDRSDAVATPDGRFMTVPSTYTPDNTIRFYPMAPLLEALAAGRDATDVEPAFVHDHPSMRGVYYQSTGVLAETPVGDDTAVAYRLMFSGGHDESGFRIVDYLFTIQPDGGAGRIEASPPMALCPAVVNDLNTPFISKDGRYVASYTSENAGNGYSDGASLKIFEITDTDPDAGTTECRPVIDFGFAAGKADFAFDGSAITFHISQGGYLTPFVNGGLPSSTITDVVVVELERDAQGGIVGRGPVQRLTTSVEAGVGSYFPAFMPDGSIFYLTNTVPRDAEGQKRFRFRVVEPRADRWAMDAFASAEIRDSWIEIAAMWERSCSHGVETEGGPFPLASHEAPWLASSLEEAQCTALLDDVRAEEGADARDWERLGAACSVR